ncbi:hypothetical protein [Chryseobacterium sp. M5A1_1a]
MGKDVINKYLADEFTKLGKLQKDVIEDLKKPQPYVSALMSGKKSVGKDIAVQLYKLYGFDPAKILTSELDYLDITKPVIISDNNQFKNNDALSDSEKLNNILLKLDEVSEKLNKTEFKLKVITSASTKAFDLLFENFDMDAIDFDAIEHKIRKESNLE